MKHGAYFRLMRIGKPVGTLLLGLPTAWALWIANHGRPSLQLILYFFCGTILMRAAGCIINDIADRHIDRHVKRTQNRPLTTGELSLTKALVMLFILLIGSLFIVLQLPLVCFYYALVALLISILYPFCKQFFAAPQLVLGLAFSMGIPIAYAASGAPMDVSTGVLFLLNFAWIVSYDTMYAMADREDDIRIGVKSTAVLFAQHDRLIIMLLQITFHTMWLYLAIALQLNKTFYGFWGIAAFILIYQHALISKREANSYITAFSSNIWYGFLMWFGLIMCF